MSEKLINQKPGDRREPSAPPSPPRTMIATTARPERRSAQWPMLIGPMIGFVLAACLAISFALALAGGAGEAALGGSHAAGPTRTAVFVL
jgi:hypothetical protein